MAWAIFSRTPAIRGPNSVSRGLTRGLALTGLFGGLSLIIFVSLDVEVMLEQKAAADGWNGAWHEIGEHVVLPLVVLMLPMLVAVRHVIRTSLAPLGAAAASMDAVVGTDRGFRVDFRDFPLEAQPFARAVNNLLERLDDVAAQREAFAADIAHEIRTPLAILMIELDQLGEPDAARLKKDVAALNRLVSQIMVMAHLDAHGVTPVPHVPVSLAEIAKEVATRFASAPAAQNRHIGLAINGEPAVPGVGAILTAAVTNLVENALRVTAEGGTVRISVGPGACLCVGDEGPGLSEAELERLSQRFARADHASPGGAGLGLAIVARIADIHGARLVTHPRRKEICLLFHSDGPVGEHSNTNNS